jgi:hypothetical protein
MIGGQRNAYIPGFKIHHNRPARLYTRAAQATVKITYKLISLSGNGAMGGDYAHRLTPPAPRPAGREYGAVKLPPEPPQHSGAVAARRIITAEPRARV